MQAGFQSDPNILNMAEAYSLDAVDIAARNFKLTLDWSEASIERVEEMLGVLHERQGIGSYIGEVFRKHHGGEWGIVQLGADRFPGIQDKNGARFWPWSRVQKRLVAGRRIMSGTTINTRRHRSDATHHEHHCIECTE
jgi:hypothetical protein